MSVATRVNGLTIEAGIPREVEVLFAQVEEYFTTDWQLPPQPTVVDVGANIGIFALECLRRTNGKARLVCCEPAPATFKSLERNLAANFSGSDITLKEVGMSDQAGSARFLYRPLAPACSALAQSDMRLDDLGSIDSLADLVYTDEYWRSPYARITPKFVRRLPRWLTKRLLKSHLTRQMEKTEAFDCTLSTLSMLIDELQLTRIDVLKIDVEGAEWSVLQGLQSRHWPLIQNVLIEVLDIDDRVMRMSELFGMHGLSNVHVVQELVFRGSNIYNIIATRPQETV